jgi:hypothetical protein
VSLGGTQTKWQALQYKPPVTQGGRLLHGSKRNSTIHTKVPGPKRRHLGRSEERLGSILVSQVFLFSFNRRSYDPLNLTNSPSS